MRSCLVICEEHLKTYDFPPYRMFIYSIFFTTEIIFVCRIHRLVFMIAAHCVRNEVRTVSSRMMQIIFGIQQVAVPKYGDIFENRV